MAGLRESGQQQYLAPGLLARAGYLRETGQYDLAQGDLDEAYEIIEAGAMKLFLVDYHLEAARLCAAQGRKEDAAEKLIGETGYKRRLKELENPE